eukprot:scaffold130770_cov32-Tisochrysis_lutea.AAC.1
MPASHLARWPFLLRLLNFALRFAMADPIGFRSLAVLTSVFEIAGDLFEEKSRGLFVAALKTTSPFEVG